MTWFERPRDPQQQMGFEMIGALIRRRRVHLGWTQRYLESQSGINQAVISRLENGKQSGLRWSRFAELVQALGGLDVVPHTRRLPPRDDSLAIDGDQPPIDGSELPTDDAIEPWTRRVVDLSAGMDAWARDD